MCNKHIEHNDFYLEDLRPITDDGLTTGALENIKGNSRKFYVDGGYAYSDLYIIGSVFIRNEIIVFAVAPTTVDLNVRAARETEQYRQLLNQ